MAVSAETNAGNAPVTRADISPEELTRRVAILKRFRELLQAQRDRFRDYLEVLDKQKTILEQSSEPSSGQGSEQDSSKQALIVHIELEEKILADIFAIQKVIDPLEVMYRTVYPEKYAPAIQDTGEEEPVFEVSRLKSALESLQAEAIARTEQNRMLLANRMDKIRGEIKTLKKNPYAGYGRSVYGEAGSPSLIDIER
jgi:hypothetical protein